MSCLHVFCDLQTFDLSCLHVDRWNAEEVGEAGDTSAQGISTG
jgi:hypothetical protein